MVVEAIEALPLANTPEVFGLHANAEIGYYTQAARDMWAHLLELQPQTGKVALGAARAWSGPRVRHKVLLQGPFQEPDAQGAPGPRPGALLPLKRVLVSGESSSGISRDDYIGQVAKDIENKMPKTFDLDQVRKHLGVGLSPTSVVLLQELERFNRLVMRMSRSLAELQRVSVALTQFPASQWHLLPWSPCLTAVGSVHRPWPERLE